jgi:hypothetical protein
MNVGWSDHVGARRLTRTTPDGSRSITWSRTVPVKRTGGDVGVSDMREGLDVDPAQGSILTETVAEPCRPVLSVTTTWKT